MSPCVTVYHPENPGERYTIAAHQRSHNVTYQTARTDLLGLEEHGLVTRGKLGKQLIFTAPGDLSEVLLGLG